MQPANPRMNITPPTTKKSHTGSKPPRSVMDEMLERTPWFKTKTDKKITSEMLGRRKELYIQFHDYIFLIWGYKLDNLMEKGSK